MKRLLVLLLLALPAFAQHTVTLSCTAPTIPASQLLPPIQQPVALSFSFLRGTVTGGPYASVGSASSCAFTDSTVAAGTTYYYVVTATVTNAVGSGPASANSAEVSAVIPGTVPVTAPAAPTGLKAVVN